VTVVGSAGRAQALNHSNIKERRSQQQTEEASV